MSAEWVPGTVVDSRESERIKFQGQVEFHTALEAPGTAEWRNVGNGGACVELGRYLRPGRTVALHANVQRLHDEPAVIAAKVAWCRPKSDGETFMAGLRFRSLDVESRFAVSTLVREAFKSRLYRDCAPSVIADLSEWKNLR